MPIIDYQSLQSSVVSNNPISTSPLGSSTYIGLNDNITTINTLYYNALATLLYAVSIISVLTFIYAGINYLMAGGDTEKTEKAKKIIIGSIIGMIIILATFLIFRTTVNVVQAPAGANMSDVIDQE